MSAFQRRCSHSLTVTDTDDKVFVFATTEPSPLVDQVWRQLARANPKSTSAEPVPLVGVADELKKLSEGEQSTRRGDTRKSPADPDRRRYGPCMTSRLLPVWVVLGVVVYAGVIFFGLWITHTAPIG
jgi:hypothetical protein